MPIPGVENYNAEFFKKNGLSLVSNNIEEVIMNANTLLKDKDMQKKMEENQDKNYKYALSKGFSKFCVKQF